MSTNTTTRKPTTDNTTTLGSKHSHTSNANAPTAANNVCHPTHPTHPAQHQSKPHQHPNHRHQSHQQPQIGAGALHSKSQPATAANGPPPSVHSGVPPRYQPPPPAANAGILKNTPSNGATLRSVPPVPLNYNPTHNGNEHHSTAPTTVAHSNLLNIKYPPDVPKLTTVYIPDGSSRTSTAPPLAVPPKGSHHQRSSLHQRHSTGHPLAGSAGPSLSGSHSNGVPVPGLLQRHPTAIGADELRASLHHHQQQILHHHHLLGQHQAIAAAHQQDMLKFVRKPEADAQSATSSHSGNGTASAAAPIAVQTTSSSSVSTNGLPTIVTGNGLAGSSSAARISAEQSRQLQQSMFAELRSLKEANQRLSDDNQELRDLCCFLDDDRQKGRKLAREWQRFGRYTASVMRQEVSAYQSKLRQLDDKQQELIRDNLELKELCLYMDEERSNAAANLSACTNCGATVRPALRDDGDGSSSSTNPDEPMPVIRQFERPIPDLNIRPTLSDQTLQYVRSLEHKIRQLEMQADGRAISVSDSALFNGRPEAVVRALQILEVREQIERDRTTSGVVAGVDGASGNGEAGMNGTGIMGAHVNGVGMNGNGSLSADEHMDDGEKALVREMCNVVWRKLEDSPNG